MGVYTVTPTGWREDIKEPKTWKTGLKIVAIT